jgi:hypothetical protein
MASSASYSISFCIEKRAPAYESVLKLDESKVAPERDLLYFECPEVLWVVSVSICLV